MLNKNKALCLLLAMAASLLLSACGGDASTPSGSTSGEETSGGSSKTITINIANVATPAGYTSVRVLDEWALSEVERRLEGSGYTIKWNKMYGGTAMAAGEELTGLGNGLADIGSIVAPYEASKLPLQNISYWFPFTTTDPEIAAKVSMQLTEEYPEFAAAMDAYNVEMLTCSGTQLGFNLFTSFPVEKLEDFSGHKIGAGGANLATVTACGATPVQSTGAESYTSIQTGVYEGWINDIQSVVNSSLYEVAPYYIHSMFGVVNNVGIGINKDFAAKLPTEVLTIIREVFKEYPLEVAKALKADEDAMTKAWIDAGGSMIELDEEVLVEWAAQLSSMPAEKAAQVNSDTCPAIEICQRYYELMKESGHEWLYEVQW